MIGDSKGNTYEDAVDHALDRPAPKDVEQSPNFKVGKAFEELKGEASQGADFTSNRMPPQAPQEPAGALKGSTPTLPSLGARGAVDATLGSSGSFQPAPLGSVEANAEPLKAMPKGVFRGQEGEWPYGQVKEPWVDNGMKEYQRYPGFRSVGMEMQKETYEAQIPTKSMIDLFKKHGNDKAFADWLDEAPTGGNIQDRREGYTNGQWLSESLQDWWRTGRNPFIKHPEEEHTAKLNMALLPGEGGLDAEIDKQAAGMGRGATTPGPNQSKLPAPRSEPEKVSKAAIRFPDGHVIEGDSHFKAVQKSFDSGHDKQLDKAVDGFTTSTGRFVDRKEALKIFEGAKQEPTQFHKADSFGLRSEGVMDIMKKDYDVKYLTNKRPFPTR